MTKLPAAFCFHCGSKFASVPSSPQTAAADESAGAADDSVVVAAEESVVVAVEEDS